MDISHRLKTIAAMVGRCNTVIDIGTDHGYIPIYLVKNNVCGRAIAADINKGPTEKARMNIELEGLDSKIEVKLGPGMTVINPGQADVAIIAGMGGNLIRDIIEDSKEVFKKLDYALLQPVQNPEVLREYLYTSGYQILDEDLCKDENKYYEIIKVRYANNPKVLDSIYYEISEVLIRKKHSMLKEYLDYKINKYNTIIEYVGNKTEATLLRKKELEQKIQKLKEIFLCI